MNPRVLVGIVVVVFAVIVGIVAFSGQSIIDDISRGGLLQLPDGSGDVLQLEVELVDVSISEVTERAAIIDVQFQVNNPNSKSVILSFIKYELFEADQRIHIGEIGERLDSFVIGSNYFTILSDQPTLLSDTITIKNTGNDPRLWDVLTSNTPSWRISGEASFNLSSMTAGGENITTFEFVP